MDKWDIKKPDYNALDDGYDFTDRHYIFDETTDPDTHTMVIFRLKNGPTNIKRSGYYQLMDPDVTDHIVCLNQSPEVDEVQNNVLPFLGIHSMIHETLPHSYTLKYGQDYELWFPDFFTIKESTW